MVREPPECMVGRKDHRSNDLECVPPTRHQPAGDGYSRRVHGNTPGIRGALDGQGRRSRIQVVFKPRQRTRTTNQLGEARVRIGVDMVEIVRLATLVQKSPTFAQQIFSSTELGAADRLPERRREEYLAGRFAVKEAALKALGVGLTRNL